MKSYIAAAAVILMPALGQANLVSINRISEIHGGGKASPFSIVTQTTTSTDLYATFDHTLSAQGEQGWVQEYSVSQKSTITQSGFEVSASIHGSATSGEQNGVDTYSSFSLSFYVDVASTLSLSGAFSRTPYLGLEIRIRERDGNTVGLPVGYLYEYGDPIPSSFQLDPQYAYVVSFQDRDSVNSTAVPNSYTATHSFKGVITPIPEPSPILSLTTMGVILSTSRMRFERKKRRLV